MPTSEMKAVPRGRICWSAVGTCVCVPTTRLVRPSQKMAHRLLLARSLTVNVDDDRVGRLLQRTGSKLALNRGERIVERIHEDAAHRIDHKRPRAVLGLDQRDAATGCAGGIIDRAQQPRRPFDENERLLLIPGMVAAGDHVGTGVDEVLIDRFGNAEAAGGVFAVKRNEIELPLPYERAEAFEQNSAPAASHDVADKENAHLSRGPAVDDLALG